MHFAPLTNVGNRCALILVFLIAQFLMIKFVYLEFKDLKGWEKNCYWVSLGIWVLFSILWIWAHIVTSWLDAGSVEAELLDMGCIDEEFHLHDLPSEIEGLQKCPKCGLPKGERTHHCSTCNKCYFRFDHHCPVVGNCIALKNMKAFMLFLFYSSILIIDGGASFLLYATERESYFSMLCWLLFCICIIFSIYTVFFGCMYIPNVCINRTTLEDIANVEKDAYDDGKVNNFKQVFGEACWKWFLPLRSNIDAFQWAVSQSV